MKHGVLVSLTLAGVSLFLVSAGSLVMQYVEPPVRSEKEITIAMRQIGHELLLHAGDSVSLILPVQKPEPFTYQLSFESAFSFIPDSLVGIVRKALSKSGIENPYIVNVIDCSNHAIVYGFQIGLQDSTTLIPCLGRMQPIGCYIVRVSFLESTRTTSHLYLLAFTGVALLFVSGKRFLKTHTPVRVDTEVIHIGRYEFLPEHRLLVYDQQRIELSEKETKLMTLFAANINQTISRELLMKQVWEDEGVIVGRSLDVFVSKLRKKLKQDESVQLTNIHGLGYSLRVTS